MEELYNDLFNKGLYTKSLTDFEKQFTGREDVLFDALGSDYASDLDEFKQKYFSPGKKQGPAKDAAVVGPVKAVSLDSTSSDGSLEFLDLSNTFSGNVPTPVQEIINNIDVEVEKENINTQVDESWVEESLLPKKEEYEFDQASGVGKRTKKTQYPSGYKKYLNKANGDLEAAKELYKKDLKSDIVKNKLTEYFKDKISGKFSYDEGILEDQEKLSEQKLASIGESLDINKKSIEDLSGNIANTISKIKNIDNTVKGVADLTREEFGTLKKQRDSYLADINAMTELQADIHSKSLELASEYKNESKILDVVKRDYGQLNNLFGNTFAGFLETGGSLMEYPKMFGTLLLSEISGLDKPTSDAVLTAVVPAFKSAESVMTKAENIKEGLVAPVSVSDINSLTDFGYWAGQVTGNVAPQVALSVAAGGSTLMPSLFMGVSAAGMKYNDMMKESLINGIEYSGLQILAATNLSGIAEAASEKISFGQMKGITSILRKNPTALKAANEYIAKNIAKGRYFTTTAAESASEVAAQLANNFIDIEILGKEDVKITDGLLDSAAAGAFMSGVIFKVPAVGRRLLYSTASQETLKQLEANSSQVLELTKELNKLEKNGADEKIVQSVKNSISTITSNSSKLIAKNYDRWSYLSKEEKTSYVNLKENLDDIKVRAMLVRDSDIGEDAKKATIENLNKEYTKTISELKKIDNIAGQRLDPVKADPEYRRKLEEDQIANIRSIMKKNGIDKDRLVEYSSKEKPSNWDNLSPALQANIEKSMGTFHDGVLYINKDKTKEQGYFTTGQHEFLHLGLFLAFKRDQNMMNKAGEMLYNHLEAELGDSLYGTEFYKRFSGYSGKVEQWEEAMTLLSESLSRGDIRKTKSLAQRLSDWFKTILSRTFGYQIEFKDGADVFRFIENFNKDIEKGKASKGFSKILQGKAVINIKGEKQAEDSAPVKTKASKAIEDKMFALEDKLNTGEISMDQYDEEMDRLISELEKQEQKIEEVEDFEVKKTPVKKKREKSDLEIELAGKAKKHKEILDGIGNNPDGYNSNDPKLWETLGSMIKSKARNFTTAKGDYAPLTNLPGFDMESMVAETQSNMINYIKKFDPSLNNSLYGYINAQLQNRMRAALKTGRVAGAEFTTDVTEAKGVIADEGGYVEVAKPDYVSISESKAFSNDLIAKSKSELLRVVRVLKSKIDAPMTVNQSISPLMRELIQGTKNMMDAAIKAEMGGKKDGKLRKWLQANKKTVIENSTTTFLMGKDAKTSVKGGIPQAIQKQIDGKWVSYPEWVGKTPDRETTWARGNTSGNYIVRRVAASQVSEADFLSQVLNPNGNPIPGRKEAIAMHLSSELSVELFIKELKDENSDISKAFETNRELRDEILADNFISEVNKQAERGLMKQSKVVSAEDTNALFDALKANDMLSKAGTKALGDMSKIKEGFNTVAILKTITDDQNLKKDFSKKDIADMIIKSSESFINPKTAKEFFNAANKAFADNIINVDGKMLVLETLRVKPTIKSSRPITQNMSEADINKEFNKMLERKSDIKAGKKISESAASRLGKYKGKFKFFLPPNAEDFIGLLYPFLGKGKQGDTDFQFFKELLIDPFNEAEQRMSEFRQDLSKDIKSINKEIGKISTIVDKKTVKELDELGYSPEQAVRIYIWSRRGEDIPDITRVERTKVNLILGKDRKLASYANHVMKITEKYGGYPPPSDHWFAGNLTTDFYEYANNNVRQGLLETWQGNIDALFNTENLSKLKAIYGKDFVKNLELTIQRMKSGVNKFHSQSKLAQSAIDFINGSVGVIMFLNMRSAVLQTISAVNFINWTDNNPIAAVKALSNPKKYASMFLKLLNSDFLKQRRAGLELNISEAEIADAATNAKNFFSRLYHKAIKIGYKPTQFADSFAIAFGGTSFLMNRIKTYEKEGFSQSEAYEKAYNDFREIAEENQQSSRTDKISNIQSSDLLGRSVFSFNNTPFQYARIVKKATLDLANGRGDWKTNLSKILYYGAVQNALFYTLQQALFRTMFDDDEEEVTKTELKLLNSMADSLLRGSGLPGAIVSMIKNVIIKAKEEEQKGWKMSPEKVALELTSISPPISYKLKKFASSVRSYKYAETDYDKIRAAARMGSVANLPADRILTKYENLTTAMSNDIDNWMRFALLAGWGKYELGLYDKDKKKAKKTNNAIKTLKIKPIKIKPIKVK